MSKRFNYELCVKSNRGKNNLAYGTKQRVKAQERSKTKQSEAVDRANQMHWQNVNAIDKTWRRDKRRAERAQAKALKRQAKSA